jgi:hypothetical protein
MKWIDHHPAGCDQQIELGTISDTKNSLDWTGDWDNTNVTKYNWEADYKSDMELDNCIVGAAIVE